MKTNIVDKLRDALEDDKYPWDATLYEDAANEIEHLRALVKELLPFMLEDVIQGMALGKPPFDPNHCDNTPDKCPDCIWFLGSTKWKARIDNGEFSQYE